MTIKTRKAFIRLLDMMTTTALVDLSPVEVNLARARRLMCSLLQLSRPQALWRGDALKPPIGRSHRANIVSQQQLLAHCAISCVVQSSQALLSDVLPRLPAPNTIGDRRGVQPHLVP
mmetsp:Transcript_22767/g.69644  ORF Transcript_22767/g.69644 Transcript_22767/m.69644 type:complete len:117 (+) Transcript_22767:62-412(+)|eukprot:scaffold224512_cov35-Tisochrysis_lutea.AAC.7